MGDVWVRAPAQIATLESFMVRGERDGAKRTQRRCWHHLDGEASETKQTRSNHDADGNYPLSDSPPQWIDGGSQRADLENVPWDRHGRFASNTVPRLVPPVTDGHDTATLHDSDQLPNIGVLQSLAEERGTADRTSGSLSGMWWSMAEFSDSATSRVWYSRRVRHGLGQVDQATSWSLVAQRDMNGPG